MNLDVIGTENPAAAVCSVCLQEVAPEQYLVHESTIVCGECKPIYFQRLRELGSTTQDSFPALKARLVVFGRNAVWGTLLYWIVFFLLGMLFKETSNLTDFLLFGAFGLFPIMFFLSYSAKKLQLRWRDWPRAFFVPAGLLSLFPLALFIGMILFTMFVETHSSDLTMMDALAAVLIFPFAFILHTMALLTLLALMILLNNRSRSRAMP